MFFFALLLAHHGQREKNGGKGGGGIVGGMIRNAWGKGFHTISIKLLSQLIPYQ